MVTEGPRVAESVQESKRGRGNRDEPESMKAAREYNNRSFPLQELHDLRVSHEFVRTCLVFQLCFTHQNVPDIYH